MAIMASKFRLSVFVLVLLTIGWISMIVKVKTWATPQGVISNDVISYYGYLPGIFIYHDISLRFKEDPSFPFKDKVWANSLPGNHFVIRMSMGLSMLYLPFFMVAHAYCLISGWPATGFSDPYEIALIISSLFYTLLGFVLLRKILCLYFSERVVSICLIAIGFGTNLFNYATVEACMSHSYLFFLINIFIWLTIKWYANPAWRTTILLSATGALTSLVRPTHILIFLLFFLYQVNSFPDLFARIKHVFRERWKMFIMVLVFFMVWFPQLAYWKYNTGDWFFFSYVGSRFYFLQPHILEGFFSYRKGWLVYTPIMVFSLMGFFFMKRKSPDFFTGSLLYVLLSTYIILSWWCWWYGGSFGQRPFIDMYGLLAIPMGCLISKIYEMSMWRKVSFTMLMFSLIVIQLYQSQQYYWGSIHYDSMTKEAYWASFLRKTPPAGWHYLLKEPDYEKARLTGNER